MNKVDKSIDPNIKKMQDQFELTFKNNVKSTLKIRGIPISNFALEHGFEVSYFNKMLQTSYKYGLKFQTMVKIAYCLKVSLLELLNQNYVPNKKI